MEIDESYIQQRILKLVAESGQSERSFSAKLGRSYSYLGNITSGRALPSMGDFLEICRLLKVSPKDFFDSNSTNPALLDKVMNDMKGLNNKDILLIESFIKRLKKE
ncbi:MAG: helix-turn-helix transcriptional regulator [Candidatus Riflebacteria bacterium]|jgi:transcriptional regulator with XRE-family HTH domain|nr:helix-turn-helix transcriptional regulator [Candidatus Riflebacteria bacterium]